MTRTIKLSKRAAKNLDKLLEYLENEWTVKVRDEFINRLDNSLKIIAKNPDSFPNSDFIKGLHKCVITKQTTLYYRFDKKHIYVITIFDNRQNPKKLSKSRS